MPARDMAVVVTGIGMVTAFGAGRDVFWEGILASRSAARTIEWLKDCGIPTCFACPVDDASFNVVDFVPDRKAIKLMSRATQHAMVASTLALRDAGLGPRDVEPERAGVVLGAGGVGLHDRDFLDALFETASHLGPERNRGDFYELACRQIHPLMPIRLLPNMAAAHVAIAHGFRGENLTICTACTSGTQALGEAIRLLREDRADVLLAGGTDAMINPVGVLGFGMLGVLSRRAHDPEHASRPFDRDRDGFVLGEGAALLVLETAGHARRRGARALAELSGYGTCSDAYRVTDEREDGSGPALAMQRALDDAGLGPSAIDYVNAHGTGTVMNDRTEVTALRKMFGGRLSGVPISSTKSQIGHLLAAAGAVEAAACILALGSQIAPPTINYATPDPECDVDVVPNKPRAMRLDHVLSNSFGFGGQNACLVVERSSA